MKKVVTNVCDTEEEPVAKAGDKPRLCFGIMWTNDLYAPHPPIKRALREFKAKLEAAGHTVIDWKHHDPAEASHLIVELYGADGGIDTATLAREGGEPLMPSVSPSSPDSAEDPGSSPRPVPVPSVYDGWQLNRRKMAYRKASLDAWMATQTRTGTGRPVDALLMPVALWAACPHDMNLHIAYTNWANLVDRPALTFPVTTVDPLLDAGEDEQPEADRVGATYDVKRWAGMPVNLQLVGHRMLDEELLGIAQVVLKDAGVAS